MTSKIKVNILADGGDNSIITSDGAGSITINNAALKSTPAFAVYLTASQTLANNTNVKIQLDGVDVDTDSAYDNTTNYRFTVPSGGAGKYLFYWKVNSDGTGHVQEDNTGWIFKNGSALDRMQMTLASGLFDRYCLTSQIIDDASVGDYYEVYYNIKSTSGANSALGSTTTQRYTTFGGYRLIGA